MFSSAEFDAKLHTSSLEVMFFESIKKLRTTTSDWLARLREAFQEKEHFGRCVKVLHTWEQQNT
jgi:hypothetical protein